jgi:hypothetical protein
VDIAYTDDAADLVRRRGGTVAVDLVRAVG